jgi:hypothetical protein
MSAEISSDRRVPFLNTFRGWVYALLIICMVGWTLYTLGDGIWLTYTLMSDATGEFAWRAQQVATGLDDSMRFAFLDTWADPTKRAAFTHNFLSSFWNVRMPFWALPTIVAGVAALLLKVRR